MANEIDNKLDYLNETKSLIKEAIINKGQEVLDTDTFRSYAEKINNIENLDATNAKIFASEEEMNQDDKVYIGKKAILYSRNFVDINREDNIDNILIPESFTLENTLETSYNAHWSGNGTNLNINLETNSATIYIEESLQYWARLHVSYISEDGLTFAIDNISSSDQFRAVPGLISFSSSLSYSNGEWSDIIGKVFKTNKSEFNGLFEYRDDQIDQNWFNTFYNFAYEEDYKLSYNIDPLEIINIRNKIWSILQNEEYTSSLYGIAYISEYENNIPKTLELYLNSYIYSSNKKYDIIYTAYDNEPTTIPTYTKHIFNLIDMTHTTETASCVLERKTFGEVSKYIALIKNLNNDTKVFGVNIQTNSTFSAESITVYTHKEDGTYTGTTLSSNLYYKRPRYLPAPSQLTQINKNELFNGKIVYDKDNIVTGDGSYLTNIKTTDFIKTWLPQLSSSNTTDYTNVYQTGKSVPYQTFIERSQIKYTDIENCSEDDAITQKTININSIDQTIDSNDILYKVYSSTYRYENTYRYNDITYFCTIGVNFNNDRRQQVTSINAVIFNKETGERIGEMSDSTIWQPISYSNYSGSGDFPYCTIEACNYIPETDEIIIVFTTGTRGWTDGCHLAIYRYNITSNSRIAKANLNLGKYGSGEYYHVDKVSYDRANDLFYLTCESFNSGGSYFSTYHICKLDNSFNYSLIYTSTIDLGWSINNWSNLKDVGPLLFYYNSSTSETYIVNLYLNKTLTLPGTQSFSNSNFVKYNDEYYIFYSSYSDSIYTYRLDRINLTNMTVINISTFTSNIGSYYLSYYNNKLCLYNSNTYKFHDLNNNELLPFYINTSISPYGISGIMIDEDNNPITESCYINVTTGDFILHKYKQQANYYKYNEVTKFPIENELFMTIRWGYSDTKDSNTNLYNSIPLTKLNVNDIKYQKYINTVNDILN